jgi:cytidylate kinase
MGTVVFPDADIKFFMVASIQERSIRRKKDLAKKGIQLSLEEIRREIHERDQRDSQRELSPLKPAKDAIRIDTTSLTIQEQVDFIVEQIQKEQ